MQPRLVLRERPAAAVQRRPLQRAVGRRARHGRRLGQRRCSRYGTWSLGAGAAAGHRRRPRRLRRRRDLRRPDRGPTSTGSTTSLHRRALPRPRRHPARRGHPCSATPTSPRTYRADRPRRARAPSTAARSPEAIVAAAPAPADRGRRQPRLAPRPHDRSRPAPLRARSSAPPTHVGYRGLDVYGMGPPSSGGSTVGEALNILEGYRPRQRDRDAGAPPASRGVALLVRRPQRLPGRPGLLRRPAARACSRTASRPSAGR